MAGYKPFSEAKAAFVRVLCFSGLVAIVVASCSTAIPFVFREHTKPNVDDVRYWTGLFFGTFFALFLADRITNYVAELTRETRAAMSRIHWGKVAVVVMSLMLMASLWYEWNGGW